MFIDALITTKEKATNVKLEVIDWNLRSLGNLCMKVTKSLVLIWGFLDKYCFFIKTI